MFKMHYIISGADFFVDYNALFLKGIIDAKSSILHFKKIFKRG